MKNILSITYSTALSIRNPLVTGSHLTLGKIICPTFMGLLLLLVQIFHVKSERKRRPSNPDGLRDKMETFFRRQEKSGGQSRLFNPLGAEMCELGSTMYPPQWRVTCWALCFVSTRDWQLDTVSCQLSLGLAGWGMRLEQGRWSSQTRFLYLARSRAQQWL